DVVVSETNGVLDFKKGDKTASLKILPFVRAEILEETIDGKAVKTLNFKINSELKQAVANWGTTRALANNIISGLQKEFSKVLEIEGVGFRAIIEDDVLVLSLGFSHPVRYKAPKGAKITVEKNAITISGSDKEIVGQTAAEIRALKKPEPYKGKGIRYRGEVIRRKAGKKAGAATVGK
ncbi:50S ribosomal protein L6, partial [Candidatus Wolfebacteria bacterium]|nr:50S ribosomal protein L6 [Candidatus Wolfebacteria bacterium]